mmetsp:Transcript_138401/g.240853  ORF Transcript_138401/g.240853 Transcript_138401/m.240853 type:complete len:205 (+) Transcript_138401:544-1158(+)
MLFEIFAEQLRMQHSVMQSATSTHCGTTNNERCHDAQKALSQHQSICSVSHQVQGCPVRASSGPRTIVATSQQIRVWLSECGKAPSVDSHMLVMEVLWNKRSLKKCPIEVCRQAAPTGVCHRDDLCLTVIILFELLAYHRSACFIWMQVFQKTCQLHRAISDFPVSARLRYHKRSTVTNEQQVMYSPQVIGTDVTNSCHVCFVL